MFAILHTTILILPYHLDDLHVSLEGSVVQGRPAVHWDDRLVNPPETLKVGVVVQLRLQSPRKPNEERVSGGNADVRYIDYVVHDPWSLWHEKKTYATSRGRGGPIMKTNVPTVWWICQMRSMLLCCVVGV